MCDSIYIIRAKACLYLSISITHKVFICRILSCKLGLIPTQILASGSIIRICTLFPINSLKL